MQPDALAVRQISTSLSGAHSLNDSFLSKQGVALTGRNRTGPPCSVGCPTVNVPGGQHANRSRPLNDTFLLM